MTTVTVRASRPYEVTIGRGLLDTVGRQAAGQWKGRSAAVVSDSTVAPLYLNRVKDSLERAGFRVHSFVFPAGEDQKNGGTYLKLLEFLAGRRGGGPGRVCRRHLSAGDWISSAAHHPLGGGGLLCGGKDRH